jgi:hypothetical protein
MTSVRSRLRCPSVPIAKALARAEASHVFAHPNDVLRVTTIKQRDGLWEIVQYGSSPSPESRSKTYPTMQSAMEAAAKDIDWLFLVGQTEEVVPEPE